MINSPKPLNKIIILIAIIFLLFYFIRDFLEGEAGKVKRLIFSTERAVEKKNLLKCIQPISFSYSDEYGNDHTSLLAIGKEVFSSQEDIHISIKDLKLELDNQKASAEISALGIARRTDKEKFDSQLVNFTVYFNKEKDGWKVIRLEFLEPKDISNLIFLKFTLFYRILFEKV